MDRRFKQGVADTPSLLLQIIISFLLHNSHFSQPKKMNEIKTKLFSSRLNDTSKLKNPKDHYVCLLGTRQASL